jgi:GTP cyclohydrolase I
MSNEITKSNSNNLPVKNSDNSNTGKLSDEPKLISNSSSDFESYSKLGFKLFDANGNQAISEQERLEMIDALEVKISEMMEILRINRNDPNSTETSRRVAKMYVNELMSGRFSNPPELTVFPNRKKVDELIISKGITVMSLCSHHWQTISGECAIGYIPRDKVIGLSKMSRIVEWFARRGQIQEELGEQIADYLEDLLQPKALGVVIKSKHYCMIARGVRGDENKSLMITSVMRGYLLDEMNLRQEFLKLIGD